MKQIFKRQTKFYRSKRFAAFGAIGLLIMLCSSTAVFAQVAIRGTVTDINDNPLIGVNVSIKGTTIGNITDLEGNYTMEAPGKNSVVVFSFIGFRSQEITIGNQSVIRVKLVEDTQKLEMHGQFGMTKKKSNKNPEPCIHLWGRENNSPSRIEISMETGESF